MNFFNYLYLNNLLSLSKSLSTDVKNELRSDYSNTKNEVHMVKSMVKCFNKQKTYPQIKIFSAFIHGRQSEVEFKQNNNYTKCELGDLIFLISLRDENNHFEKMTINQAKKDSNSSKSIIWNKIQANQLYLLTNFPIFKGKGKLIKGQTYNLHNYSKCLGSYTLLHKPEDFIFMSAPLLGTIVNGTKLKHKDINSPNLLLHRFQNFNYYSNYLNMYTFGNIIFSRNIDQFIEDFLAFNIGELVYVDKYHTKSPCRKLWCSILNNGPKKQKSNAEFIKLRDNYFLNNKDDYEDQDSEDIDIPEDGMGLIYVDINLSENTSKK